MRHVGPAGHYLPVYSPAFIKATSKPHRKDRAWIIDAGDTRNDAVTPPPGELAYYYAECEKNRRECITFGSSREKVSSQRKGRPLGERAEIPSLCAHLLIGIMADFDVSDELEPLPRVCRIPLSRIPERPNAPPASTLLHAGGGGAIAHQVMWAESLDPVLRRANRKGHIVVVDSKTIHESCRSRQWGYERESLHQPKARCTARWLTKLFPPAKVSFFAERLSEAHFQRFSFREAVSSIDNWTGRRLLAELCEKYGLVLWSAGSSFFGGFARQVSKHNPLCASAWEGVERLNDRPDDDGEVLPTSCSAPCVPLPSSVIPQMILGSFIACQRRSVLLGQADPEVLARGIEVHLTHNSDDPVTRGLRYSPGRLLNLKKNAAGLR
jgi:molybdopterin/thiamine biosynthesis adenylyltransferase